MHAYQLKSIEMGVVLIKLVYPLPPPGSATAPLICVFKPNIIMITWKHLQINLHYDIYLENCHPAVAYEFLKKYIYFLSFDNRF